MRRTLLMSMAICLLLLTSLPAHAATPNDTCEQFMTAMKGREWQKAYNCFSKGLQARTPYQGWALLYEQYAPMFTIEHWKIDVNEKGEKAVGKISVTSRTDQDEHTVDQQVELVKENGEWRISYYK